MLLSQGIDAGGSEIGSDWQAACGVCLSPPVTIKDDLDHNLVAGLRLYRIAVGSATRQLSMFRTPETLPYNTGSPTLTAAGAG